MVMGFSKMKRAVSGPLALAARRDGWKTAVYLCGKVLTVSLGNTRKKQDGTLYFLAKRRFACPTEI